MTTDQTAPDPSITAPPVVDSQTGPKDPPAETPAPPKKRAAKKAAASTPAPPPEPAKKDARSLYLPALPDGFDYTTITATGANGETITVTAAAGPDAKAGSADLAFDGAGLTRETNYADMKSAIGAGANAARAMAKIAAQEASLAKAREEALGL